MSATLYYGSGSIYAWRVWVKLEHKAVPHEVKLLSFGDGDLFGPKVTTWMEHMKILPLIQKTWPPRWIGPLEMGQPIQLRYRQTAHWVLMLKA